MRTLVDIPEKQIQALSIICAAEKVSRAEVIREAIAYYIDKKKPQADEAFGIWQDQTSMAWPIRSERGRNGKRPVRHQYLDRLPQRH